MTTFDEEKLQRALRDAANGFAVSESAINSILDEARDTTSAERRPRLRGFIERTGRVRSTVMAVAASAVVLAVAVPLFIAESPALTSAARSPSDARFAAIPKELLGTPKAVVSGTGFLSSQTPASGSVVVTNTKVVTTGSESSAIAAESSLRVEEVGTIRLSVAGSRFQSTLTRLTDFATTDGGFVASTRSHMGSKANHSYSTGTIVLQVPEHDFTMLVDQVRHSGVATSVVTSATDVTGQYVDLQARISALQVSRSQYLKIMTRTGTISGILQVQNQLNNIQSEIEQLQAQLGLLNTETTYATLTVSLSEAGHESAGTHGPTGLDKAWHQSLHGFVAGFEWLIRIAGPLLFALLVLAALLLLGRWTWRATERRRNRMS